MEKKDLTILKEQLNATSMSIIIISSASVITIMVGYFFKTDFPGWFTILVDYVIPWIYTLIIILLFVRIFKIKRSMKAYNKSVTLRKWVDKK
ncbi:hypothetical protein [Bacillus pseudomycoides]|uniref:Uncharacterized protein n=1 Tax=Bacillus pseudomycoides TaxID=64104 RepID=A0ABD6T8B3_9BACI|nr:hypothetical protein [Bacillus pseudomycoides]PFX35288.1 hypothetical protein COL32_30735 [Bacillus pseudomycoides]PGA76469.1 hypothetical protein COL87_01225 [Bacillus pseudomycoides]PHE92358.1 hypothetical protein COF78_17330 [Bacillus pseudomycoides]PHE99934.1 hypothetical protein COF81_09450 [Bacillus pseudomycoides]